jgi:hypothetical protein
METKICNWCSVIAQVYSPTTKEYACNLHRALFKADEEVWPLYGPCAKTPPDTQTDTNVAEMSTPFDDPRPHVYGELCILRRLHVLYRVTRSINIKPDEAAAAAIEIEALEIALMEFVS